MFEPKPERERSWVWSVVVTRGRVQNLDEVGWRRFKFGLELGREEVEACD